jgi:tripeptide aminopeptidase
MTLARSILTIAFVAIAQQAWAPTFKEKIRAEYYQKRMQELGFKDASIDAEGNVIALRKGTGGGRPRLVVSAHLDTVFPEGTDVTVKERTAQS